MQNLENEVGGKRKLELLSVYVKADVKERLEKWAEREDRSISWLVARLIDQALTEGKDGEE